MMRWKALDASKGTTKPLSHVQEDVPELLHKPLYRNNKSAILRAKAYVGLGIAEGECTEFSDQI